MFGSKTKVAMSSARTAGSDQITEGWTQREIGGVFPKGAPVTALSRKSDHIDLFICGTDGGVYNSWWSGSTDWSGIGDNWGAIGGSFSPGTKVAAVARGPDVLDVFVCGADGKVYGCWWTADSGWSGADKGWGDFGGEFPPGAEVTALARVPQTLDLFACGTDGHVYTKSWYEGGDWSDWRDIGGVFPPGAKVSVVARTPDILDAFVCGTDGKVYGCWWTQNNYWSGLNGWGPIGGDFTPGAEVVTVSRSTDNLDLFVSGKDGAVNHAWWYTGGGWSSANGEWATVPSGKFSPFSQVTALARASNILDVFVSDSDNQLTHASWDDKNDWSSASGSWDLIGKPQQPGAKVSAVARDDSSLDAFVCDSDGRVYVVYWNKPSDAPTGLLGSIKSKL